MEEVVKNCYGSGDKFVYKQLLQPDECDQLNNHLTNMINRGLFTHNIGQIATGSRLYVDFDLKENKYICDRLITTLDTYFTDLQIDPNARLYNQRFGEIKPHFDKNHDGVSNYTCLIYLTDDFTHGKLSVKVKRSKEEIEESNKHHKVFTLEPRVGYGVIFSKDWLHWAEEVYDGSKNFLLIHLYSSS